MLQYLFIFKDRFGTLFKKVCYPYNKKYGLSNNLPDYFFNLVNVIFFYPFLLKIAS